MRKSNFKDISQNFSNWEKIEKRKPFGKINELFKLDIQKSDKILLRKGIGYGCDREKNLIYEK